MGIKVKVEGLDDLRRQSEQAAALIEKGIKRSVKDGLAAIRDEARDDVPVGETQELRDGISIAMDSDGLGGAVGVFGPAREYAKYPEFGTSSQTAQPFMTPAAERERRRFPRRVVDDVRRELA